MIHLTLQRDNDTGEETEGTMRMEGQQGQLVFYTIERPWKDNKPHVSCIPKGTYKFVPHDGPSFKDVWRLVDVPGRSAILIHVGNTVDDVIGCIAVGLRKGKLKGKPAVLESRTAIDILRKAIGKEGGSITIL